MRFYTTQSALRLVAITLFSVILSSCGQGDGPTSIEDPLFAGGSTEPPVVVAPPELITNGTFESGVSGWVFDPTVNSTFVATTDQSTGPGSSSGNLKADGAGSFPTIQQANLAIGTVMPNQAITVSFDLCGAVEGAGGVFFAQLFSDPAIGSGLPSELQFVGGGPLFPTDQWQQYTLTTLTGANVEGGVSLLFKTDCGGNTGCVVNAYIDNVSLTLDSDTGNVSGAGGACPIDTGGGGGGGGGADVPVPFSTVVYDDAYADIWEGLVCCGSAAVTEETAADTAFGQVVQVDYTGGNTIAGLKYGPGAELLDASAFEASGTLEFDALVTRAGNGEWKLKLEGATGGDFVEVPFSDSNEGVAPVEGVWQHYTFDIASALSGGSLKWNEVKLILFFSDFGNGLGAIQVDNIVFKEAALVISENGFDDIWEGLVCCGSAAVTEETAADTAFGQVVQVDYTGGNTIAGLKYGPGAELLDASAFEASGTLEFDALVTRAGNGEWKLKLEGATGGDFVEVPFSDSNEGVAPVEGVWQHYTFDIASALSGGSLKWNEVKLVLFFSDFGNGLGQIQVDNVGFRPGTGGGGGGGGPSGTATIDFESGGVGADFNWITFENGDDPPLEVISNPVPGVGNMSATVGAYTARSMGQPFAGVESGPGDFGGYVIDASTRYVKLWVYKTVISDVGMQLTVGAAARPAVRVANTVTNQWEQLTFDFNELIGFGEWALGDITKIVIFPDWNDAGRVENTIYIDNISFESSP